MRLVEHPRIIQFRGQSVDTGKWLYGSLVFVEDKPHIYVGHCFVEVKSETIGQFIGIADSAGTFIYDGDVISVNGKYEKIVSFRSDRAGFCLANVSDLKNSAWMDIWQSPHVSWWNDFRSEIKVVGNIFEERN